MRLARGNFARLRPALDQYGRRGLTGGFVFPTLYSVAWYQEPGSAHAMTRAGHAQAAKWETPEEKGKANSDTITGYEAGGNAEEGSPN